MQDQCRACRKETDRRTYLNRSEAKEERYRAQDREAAARNVRLVYEYVVAHPCVDCGESDPVVLEFDHVVGEKRYNVADLVRSGRNWQYICKEIEKCEVRCANCHRRATAKRNGNLEETHLESGGKCAHVAQSVEHILGKNEANSSILFVGSREILDSVCINEPKEAIIT